MSQRVGYTAAASLISTTNATATAGATTFNNISPRLNPVGVWGTIKRNANYSGPALRVENAAAPGTTTDVFFNSYGFIRDPLPYGADTRVVTLYDQFGTTDLFATLADGIHVRESDITYGSWLLDFTESGGLASTALTDGTQAWELGNPVWALGHIRTSGALVRSMWGVPANTNFLEVGLFQNGEDLTWRLNNSSVGIWTNANWSTNFISVQNVFATAIGDASAGSPATAYFNAQNAGTLAFTSPIVYDVGKALNIGDGLSGFPFLGQISELAIFDPNASTVQADIDAIHAALREIYYIPLTDEVVVSEQRAHVVVGAQHEKVSAKTQQNYVVLGGAKDSVKASNQRVQVVLGAPSDQNSANMARLYAIIIP